MRLEPPSMWRDPPTSDKPPKNTSHTNQNSNPRAPFSSSLWHSFTAQPLAKQSKERLEKRKDDKTITITNTDTITEQLTIYHNQTVYTTLTTEIFFTRNITSFVPTTITQSMTVTSALTVSVPVTTTLSMTVPSTTSSNATPNGAHNAANSQSPPVAAEQHRAGLSMPWTVAIVAGVFGFLLLVAAVLWGVRWWLRKYRWERVQRKRLQTEANEMPVLGVGKEGGGGE